MKQLIRYTFLLGICALLAACGGSKVKPQDDAQKYFQQGERYFEGELYDDAIASWEKARDTFYSPELNMLAELKIAEAYFVSKRYAEAASAYKDFLTQHPNDPREGSIMFRLGLSYYYQILSADRDQTYTENALQTLQQFVARYPDHARVQEAKNLILRCQTRLADHEVYVGRFYLKKEQFKPAIHRLEKVLQNYPDYYYRDEAYFYLLKAYRESGQPQKAQSLLDKLVKEFPSSEMTEEARELMADQ